MTIRRRLFFSNILMIVIPVVLSILFSYMILFSFTGRSSQPMERAFPKAFEIIWNFRVGEDETALIEGAREFNREFGEFGTICMIIAREDQFVYPDHAHGFLSQSTLNLFHREGISGTVTINKTRYLIEQAGDYRIFVVDTNFQHAGPGRPLLFHFILLFSVMVTMILLTNRGLTYLFTKHITKSLGLLSEGSQQLQEGNLGYRIQYRGKDEFGPVCESFNIMAQHLQTLIDSQQRDYESRKELLAGISHDLRTPLTSIKAYVEGLLDGVAGDMAGQLKYLGIIRNKAEEINQLVDKLFLFSKLDIGEFPFYHEKVDVGEELQAFVHAVRIEEDYRSSGLQVDFSPGESPLYVDADPVQLHNAMVNILENSARYCDKDLCHVQICLEESESCVEVQVTDNGPGVPQESLDKIFDVFYRTDPSRQNPSRGSGLGLAITSKIIHKMGGDITAENSEGGGLRVRLRLPKYQPREDGQHEADSHR